MTRRLVANLQTVRDPDRYAQPPTDEEKYLYLRGGQHRWFEWVQYLSFLAVAAAIFGFARISYGTLIFVPAAALLLVEQTLSLYTSTRPRRLDRYAHLARVLAWRPRRYPSVDVWVPTCGEDLEVIRNTLDYVAGIVWKGRLTVYVLDDSRRPAVRQETVRRGYQYLSRDNNEYFKAGNLRFGFDRSSGEYILILDTDFVPRPDILTELLPYFDDDIGIVQSPQFFDTTKTMGWMQRGAGATQELFYRFIQTSRDRYGAAICVGSSAIYRREAITAMGGFPKVTHSEDLYTSMYMSDHGYHLRYVPVVVSKGVAPDNVDNFIAQQYRWCQGTMNMISSPWFHRNNLTLPQRLAFWAGFLYYGDTALGSLLIPLPALIMLLAYPVDIRWSQMLYMTGALLLWTILYPTVMRQRWRPEVLRVQLVYSYAHLFCIFDLLRQQAAAWHPTGVKERAPTAVRVKRFYTFYLGVTTSATCAALAVRADQLDPYNFVGLMVFTVLNLYLTAPLVADGVRAELRAWHAARQAFRPSRPALLRSVGDEEAAM